MNTALLLSGGTGSRIQTDIPKQYIRVAGKMIITYSLETLANVSSIDRILIVAAKEWRERIITDARQHGICTDKIQGFAVPGSSRQSSILNGLQCIVGRDMAAGKNDTVCAATVKNDNCDAAAENDGICDADRENADVFGAGPENGESYDTDTVLIHDAARPMLTETQINACFAALDSHDGVLPALPMKDTIYLSEDGGQVTELLDRSKLFAGQAPELFCLKKYYQANIMLLPDRINQINGSTEPAILAGMDIVMIPGDEGNFKITTNSDMERFRKLCGM